MVILVTGCRSGFGLHIAVQAARRGHIVYAGLRDLQTRDALVAASEGLDVRPIALDVTDATQREEAVAGILAEHGRLDGLVNNAGIALGGFLEQVDEDELRQVFDVNVFGLWALTRQVLPAMRAQGAGRIVNVSSMSGFMAFPGLGVYAASKFALEGLTEAWRHELSLFGIDIYLVEPGAYATDIWHRNKGYSRNADDPASPWTPFARSLDARFGDMAAQRARDPHEVAVLCADLLDGPRRRLRHPIGPATGLRGFMKRFLPFSVIEVAVRRVLLGGPRS